MIFDNVEKIADILKVSPMKVLLFEYICGMIAIIAIYGLLAPMLIMMDGIWPIAAVILWLIPVVSVIYVIIREEKERY